MYEGGLLAGSPPKGKLRHIVELDADRPPSWGKRTRQRRLRSVACDLSLTSAAAINAGWRKVGLNPTDATRAPWLETHPMSNRCNGVANSYVPCTHVL